MPDEATYRRAEADLWSSVGVAPTESWLPMAAGRSGAQVRVRAMTVGDGPAVVFLHGVNTAGAVWAPLVAALGDGFRCIVVDRPGCGLSEPVPGRVKDADAFRVRAAALVAELLDAAGLDRAAVVSTSLGGFYALHGAAAHPERIAGVAELGWPVGAPNGHLPLVMRIGGFRALGKVMARMPAPRAAVKPMLGRIGLRQALDADRVSPELVTWFHALLRHTATMRNELDNAPPIIDPIRGMNDSILFGDDVLGRIRVPVGFLWGDGDPFGDPAIAEAFVDRVPGATLTMVPGAGHAPWIDDPAGAAAFVRARCG